MRPAWAAPWEGGGVTQASSEPGSSCCALPYLGVALQLHRKVGQGWALIECGGCLHLLVVPTSGLDREGFCGFLWGEWIWGGGSHCVVYPYACLSLVFVLLSQHLEDSLVASFCSHGMKLHPLACFSTPTQYRSPAINHPFSPAFFSTS